MKPFDGKNLEDFFAESFQLFSTLAPYLKKSVRADFLSRLTKDNSKIFGEDFITLTGVKLTARNVDKVAGGFSGEYQQFATAHDAYLFLQQQYEPAIVVFLDKYKSI